MRLPVMPPVSPMLAKLSRDLPRADGLLYEPKWDGFRCIVFRDGDEVELGSRNERPLTRYFPELPDPIKRMLPDKCVIDGEVVIAGEHGLEFDALQLRIHPAASRVAMLSREMPASFVGFDCLAIGNDDLRALPFRERRAALESAFAKAEPPLHITPITDNPDVAADWFERFEGAGLDGVVAKPPTLAYRENERVMIKVKHERTAEFVVAGFRWHKSGGVIGSLLLGLYDDSGVLHHVGVIGAFPMKQRAELVDFLAPYRDDVDGHPWREWMQAEAHEGKRLPGAVSRWNANKDLSFEPIRPELVVEAAYEHMQGDRLRHAAQFRRFRAERDPKSCTYSQLSSAAAAELAQVFGANS